MSCVPMRLPYKCLTTRDQGPAPCLFFFQAEDGIRAIGVTGVQTCALPISGVSLRALSIVFLVACAVGLLDIPVYLDVSAANDSLRSAFDVSALVPLFGVTSFGRALLDLELSFALFAAAGCVGVWVDRPERERRSVAELAAGLGALMAAAAVLIIPGTSGHAAQTPPRGLTLGFDWLHMAGGSVWLGGLIGLLVRCFAAPPGS